MLVQNWMTTEVITVTPETSLLKIGKLMRDNSVRRLPVLDDKGHVVGIISDRDVRDASPSKATTLDMYEMHYLLAELKAKDIMTPRPFKPTDTVEKAAMLMLDNKFGGLPVVEESGRLVGIISDQDVFKALVSITGVREGGIQLGIEIANQPGAMKPVFDLLRAHGPGYSPCSRPTIRKATARSFCVCAKWKTAKPRKRSSPTSRNMPICCTGRATKCIWFRGCFTLKCSRAFTMRGAPRNNGGK